MVRWRGQPWVMPLAASWTPGASGADLRPAEAAGRGAHDLAPSGVGVEHEAWAVRRHAGNRATGPNCSGSASVALPAPYHPRHDHGPLGRRGCHHASSSGRSRRSRCCGSTSPHGVQPASSGSPARTAERASRSHAFGNCTCARGLSEAGRPPRGSVGRTRPFLRRRGGGDAADPARPRQGARAGEAGGAGRSASPPGRVCFNRRVGGLRGF